MIGVRKPSEAEKQKASGYSVWENEYGVIAFWLK
jgi:hypothetical protein